MGKDKGTTMPQLTDEQTKKILQYSTARKYIGNFAPCELYAAVGKIRKSHTWDNPVRFVDLPTGKIDGDVICDALWYEMSYNPVRFGTVSPFMFNNRNNIYLFCTTQISDKQSPIAEVQYKLIEYMSLNANPRGQWNDVLHDPVSIQLIDGYTNKNYQKLSVLCAAIKIIACQNAKDFKPKRSPYRPEIIKMVEARHPNGVRPAIKQAPCRTEITPKSESTCPKFDPDEEYIYRLENTLDNLRITLDNPHSVSADQYQQALDDYEVYSKMLVDYLAKVYKR